MKLSVKLLSGLALVTLVVIAGLFLWSPWSQADVPPIPGASGAVVLADDGLIATDLSVSAIVPVNNGTVATALGLVIPVDKGLVPAGVSPSGVERYAVGTSLDDPALTTGTTVNTTTADTTIATTARASIIWLVVTAMAGLSVLMILGSRRFNVSRLSTLRLTFVSNTTSWFTALSRNGPTWIVTRVRLSRTSTPQENQGRLSGGVWSRGFAPA